MQTQLRTFLVLIAVLLLGLPAAAHANGGDAVIRDCAQDGVLNKHYSQKQLEQAYKNLPSDIDEYTDCRAVIRGAMGGGSGSPGGSAPNGILTPSGAVAGSPADIKALENVINRKHPRAVVIAGHKVEPGNAGLDGALSGLEGSSGMPTALVAAIAALMMLGIVTTYLAVRTKVPALGRALRIRGR